MSGRPRTRTDCYWIRQSRGSSCFHHFHNLEKKSNYKATTLTEGYDENLLQQAEAHLDRFLACELKAVNECLRVVIRRQREGAALLGVVILTDCRVLKQALGGSGSESMGRAMLLADYLQNTEGGAYGGSVAPVTCRSYRQRDNLWTSEPRKGPATTTEDLSQTYL
ncbi:hypothetical protein PoB_000400000 [Plakobranchus ocellatus]|uniref:Uncharacterized protein n=1 Tax=Plakobranchus ocellatus TaxID=259542 RepID=A0AAV3Y394_9GAST|nr:hypothetical protein PoB_000400000 [Plakobranchus ocellatus]